MSFGRPPQRPIPVRVSISCRNARLPIGYLLREAETNTWTSRLDPSAVSFNNRYIDLQCGLIPSCMIWGRNGKLLRHWIVSSQFFSLTILLLISVCHNPLFQWNLWLIPIYYYWNEQCVFNNFIRTLWVSEKTPQLYVTALRIIFTRGLFWPLGIFVACVCLCASITCLSVQYLRTRSS